MYLVYGFLTLKKEFKWFLHVAHHLRARTGYIVGSFIQPRLCTFLQNPILA